MKPHLTLIAAVARNGIIGRANRLPWHLPEDLKHFKALTMGRPMIMGRKTWESLPGRLPGRPHLVVSGNPQFRAEGAAVFPSLAAALAGADPADEIFIIGGATLYAEALPLANRLQLTELDADFAGDTRFPEYDRTHWRETARDRQRAAAGFDYAFVTYERNPTDITNSPVPCTRTT